MDSNRPCHRYFQRNQGEWNWCAHFDIKSWTAMWSSDLTIFNKLRIALLIFMQNLFGPFIMWTRVQYDERQSKVHHSTRLKKWGLTWYRSEKTFFLNEQNSKLRVEGFEYHWPAMNTPVPFRSLQGLVDASSKQAWYQMPLLGVVSECRTILEPLLGTIDLETSWLKGHFSLTEDSLHVLTSRFFSTVAG